MPRKQKQGISLQSKRYLSWLHVSLACGKYFLFCEISLYGCSFVCTSRSGLILVHAKEATTSYFIAVKEVFVSDECFSGLWQGFSVLWDFIVWVLLCFFRSFWFDISTYQWSKDNLFHCNERSILLQWMISGLCEVQAVLTLFCLENQFCLNNIRVLHFGNVECSVCGSQFQ